MNQTRPFDPSNLGAGIHWHSWEDGNKVQLRGKKCERKPAKVYARNGETWVPTAGPEAAPDGVCELKRG
jgi:hypothetical protein